jgi:lipoate-protein ligase B
MINPCGMEIEMVSIADLISPVPILADVQQGILGELAMIFSLELVSEEETRSLC